MKINFTSYSKINTKLQVKNYLLKHHRYKLSSNIAILKLSDKITINKSTRTKVTYYHRNTLDKIHIKNDIIKKTIFFFNKKYSTNTKLLITIKKFIPIGYGLGGGSSNACLVLQYLYNLHKINYKYFNADAFSLGSDVSLFKDNNPKNIDGIFNIKKIYKKYYIWKKIHLIFPTKKNPTKKIFQIFKSLPKTNLILPKHINNDLLKSAMSYNEELKKIIYFIQNYKYLVTRYGMTGSGSGIFIIFKQNMSLNSFFRDFKSHFPLASIEKSEYFS